MNALEQATEDLLAIELPDRPNTVQRRPDPSQYDSVYDEVLRSPRQQVQNALHGVMTPEAAELILVEMVGLPHAEKKDYPIAGQIAQQALRRRDELAKKADNLW